MALAAAIYFVIWWTVLFAVLPWGVQSQHEAGKISPGSDPGAPARPLPAWLAVTVVVFAWVWKRGLSAYSAVGA